MPIQVARTLAFRERRWYGILTWVLAWALMWWLDGQFVVTNLALMLVLASSVAGLWLGPLAALLTNTVSILLFSFFFVNPRLSFMPALREDLVLLVSVYGVSTVTSYLTVRLRRAVANEALQAARAGELRLLSDRLREASDWSAKVDVLRKLLSEHADIPAYVLLTRAHFVPGDSSQLEFFGDPSPFQKQRLIMKWKQFSADMASPSAMDDSEYAIPVCGQEKTWGIVMFHDGFKPSTDWIGYSHFRDLCHLLGMELERYVALTQAREATEQASTQAIRNTLLTAISHDYHTPLSTIMGAATVLVEQANGVSHPELAGLASTIVEETEHLHRMTNNTLQLARLDTAGIEVNKNWESLEEIIGTVIARIKIRFFDRQFIVSLPPDLPLLHVDVVLLMQLLDNLLQNSLKYSRSSSVIRIDAISDNHEVLIRVSDRGEGIPGWWHEQVFEIFQRVDVMNRPSDAGTGKQQRRGAGVGLAVCRAIARVHGGRIWIEDNPGGGTRVNLVLPIGAPPMLPFDADEELK
jgi:two-component system, OmpR family, sensor histidine kinase KdpD